MEGLGEMMDLGFYRGKKVLITGNTGFKGAWLCEVLLMQGASVIGYSLESPTDPNLFSMLQLEKRMTTIQGDVRDRAKLLQTIQKFEPEIVIHLAAQPIVREGYRIPAETYEINVLGTVNLLEAIRLTDCVRSFVNVTTDKVYFNTESERCYVEEDRLDGFDPYANSKSCSELVTATYIRSFFTERNIAVSTCRAGNVIGGGDFALNRIIPDCVRAMENKQVIQLRNPNAVRPFQHVLEPIIAYLYLAACQYQNKKLAGCYNIGPQEGDCVTTKKLVQLFCDEWGEDASFMCQKEEGAVHESVLLKLNSDKFSSTMSWKPKWDIEEAVRKTVAWSKTYVEHGDLKKETQRQITQYLTDKSV